MENKQRLKQEKAFENEFVIIYNSENWKVKF